jgi:hypothetical protein
VLLPTVQWSMPHFSCCYKPCPLQAHWERWLHTHLLQPACLFTVRMKECPSFPPGWSVPHFSCCYKLSPHRVCWAGAATPAFSHWLIYLQFDCGVPLPHFPELRAPRPLCYLSFFFFSCLFIIQFVFFSFFPGWGSVCPGGYADLSQGCL